MKDEAWRVAPVEGRWCAAPVSVCGCAWTPTPTWSPPASARIRCCCRHGSAPLRPLEPTRRQLLTSALDPPHFEPACNPPASPVHGPRRFTALVPPAPNQDSAKPVTPLQNPRCSPFTAGPREIYNHSQTIIKKPCQICCRTTKWPHLSRTSAGLHCSTPPLTFTTLDDATQTVMPTDAWQLCLCCCHLDTRLW